VGHEGFVTEPLKERLLELQEKGACENLIFLNCGPKPMIEAAIALQKQFVSEDRIYSSVDYMTKCGVGICGACTTPDGLRSCVDGPYIRANGKSTDGYDGKEE